MSALLYPHNQAAYEAASAMLEENGKAAIIHPTGTGKSFIGFQYAADRPEENILWLAPSEYIFRTQTENWKRAQGPELHNVTFLTYARLFLMTPEEYPPVVDTVIFDEFHRCGAEQWGAGVQRLLHAFPKAKRLGLTATNIRYLDNQRDMALELFDGFIASEMSLGQAIVRGILPAPKYVLSIFKYKDDLAKYQLRAKRIKSKATRDAAEEILEKLRRALDQAEGMDLLFQKHMTDKTGKYLVFCANAEHMAEMVAHVPEWFSGIDPAPHVYTAYSEDPGTSRAFAAFKSDDSRHLKLLFCIDMLNEGIHVDDVSGVILLRPTVSPIVYKQQIGRALSASHSTAPIIFDVVMNIENLYSISSIQEEMELATVYYRSLGDSADVMVDTFEVVDEVHDCLELFDRLNETLTASWDIMYEQAKKYYESYCDLNVPVRYITEEGYTLGSWLYCQRKIRKGKMQGRLTAEQIAKLDAIGMRWESVTDLNWEKYYQACVKYREEFGDLRVKTGYITPEGIPLGSWIMNLRTKRKSGISAGYLTDERIRALDELGMQWDIPDYLFEQNYAAAARYHREHGNLYVPVDYIDPDGNRLGQWIGRLRMVHAGKAKGQLSDDQIARLNALGMVWGNRNDIRWEEGYRHAAEYYAAHGALPDSPGFKTPDGYRLGGWILDQREKYRAGVMKDERREKLDQIGMVWNPTSLWESKYALAEAYYKAHGNLLVPHDYVIDDVRLGAWVSYQRKFRNRLTVQQIAKLDAIHMPWATHNVSSWEDTFEEARGWLLKCGEIPPDALSARGYKLRDWLKDNQRRARAGRLSADRAEKVLGLTAQ